MKILINCPGCYKCTILKLVGSHDFLFVRYLNCSAFTIWHMLPNKSLCRDNIPFSFPFYKSAHSSIHIFPALPSSAFPVCLWYWNKLGGQRLSAFNNQRISTIALKCFALRGLILLWNWIVTWMNKTRKTEWIVCFLDRFGNAIDKSVIQL